MNSHDIAMIINEKPLDELDILTPSQRSKLVEMGFSSIHDVFSLSEAELTTRFPDDKKLIQDIKVEKCLYDMNPKRFCLRATKGSLDNQAQRKTYTDRLLNSYGIGPRPRLEPDEKHPLRPVEPTGSPAYKVLKQFELDCATKLKACPDELESTLAFQLFDFTNNRLEEAGDAFADFLSHSTAGLTVYERISLIRHKLPHALVAHVADQAGKLYNSQEGFWNAYFAVCNLPKGKAQEQFKDAFIQSVRNLGLPHYDQSDNRNYYFYTALLNGGLSTDLWRSMWTKTLIPLAKHHSSLFSSELRGKDLLAACVKTDGTGITILNELLQKAPASVVEPMLISAYRVAEQLVHASGTNLLLTNFDMPANAVEGLRLALKESRNTGIAGAGSITMMPKAKLILNLQNSCLALNWKKWIIPEQHQDCKVRIFVNGEPSTEQTVRFGPSGPFIPEQTVNVKPSDQYTATVQIVKEAGEKEEIVASTTQAFRHNRPHCFEFSERAHNVYRLRRTNETIKRTRHEAFVHRNTVKIAAGPGMTLHERIVCRDAWQGYIIQLADIDSGASCRVLSAEDNKELSMWHERYRAHVNSETRIGETLDGTDVYHHIVNGESVNMGLPRIALFTREPIDSPAVRNLSATLFMDNRTMPVPFDRISPTEEDIDRGCELTEIRLAIEKCFLDAHATNCRIEIRQGTVGHSLIFSYNFVLAPIANFRLAALYQGDVPKATYRFGVVEDMHLTIPGIETHQLHRGSDGSISTSLEDETIDVNFTSAGSNKLTKMKLHLAGIKLALDKKVTALTKNGVIYLDEVSRLRSRSKKLEVTYKGSSKDCGLYISMGITPLALEDPCKPGTIALNPFDGIAPSNAEKQLTATISFGHSFNGNQVRRGEASLTLLAFCPSYGLSDTARIQLVNKEAYLVFHGAARCPLILEIKQRRSPELPWDTVAGQYSIAQGASTVHLSRTQERALRKRSEKLILCGPPNRNGKIDLKRTMRITLEE